jgi:hypothetical protein
MNWRDSVRARNKTTHITLLSDVNVKNNTLKTRAIDLIYEKFWLQD